MALNSKISSVITIREQTEIKNASKENNCSEISESEDSRLILDDNRDLTMQQSKNIAQDIIKGIFHSNLSKIERSRSNFSTSSHIENSLDMDKRLKGWYKSLQEREQMQRKISRKTGKRPEEMLFNLPVSVEQRDKGTIQRLLDVAGRMNPETLSKKTPSVLPAYINRDTCLTIPELHETLPNFETKGQTMVEISGLPSTIKSEILGMVIPTQTEYKGDNSKWVNSKALDQHIGEKSDDIRHVVEFYPAIDKLEVIGTELSYFHDKEIYIIDRPEMITISGTTSKKEDSSMVLEQTISEVGTVIDPRWRHVNLGIKINNKVLILDHGGFCEHLEYSYYFECEPYQVQLQNVMRLENIGKRWIQCEWERIGDKRTYRGTFSNENFLFGDTTIVLLPGDVHVTRVVFQPFSVCKQRQIWMLRFYLHMSSLFYKVILHGKCVPPAMYTNKLKKLMNTVIDKSNDFTMRNLAQRQSALGPLIKPPEDLCPHKRELNDLDIFNNENIGYRCDRFDDIESLRMLYKSLKKPREPAWDLRLESIKQLILRILDPLERELYFERFVRMKESINSDSDKRSEIRDYSSERERSCLIYVRGCIANGIDEWEDLVATLEQRAFNLEFQRFFASLDENNNNEPETKPWLVPLKYGNPKLYVLKKLRSKKYYRDSIYIQTYSVICDIVENIVSVIESTDYI